MVYPKGKEKRRAGAAGAGVLGVGRMGGRGVGGGG